MSHSNAASLRTLQAAGQGARAFAVHLKRFEAIVLHASAQTGRGLRRHLAVRCYLEDLRTPAFLLQGLGRVYRKVLPRDAGAVIERQRIIYKEVEDALGQFDAWHTLFGRAHTAWRAPAAVQTWFHDNRMHAAGRVDAALHLLRLTPEAGGHGTVEGARDIPGEVDVDEGRRAAGLALRLEDRRGKDRLVIDGFGLVRGYVVPPIEDDTAEVTQIDRELLGRASARYERTMGRWQLLADAYGHGTTRLTHFFLDPTLTTPEAQEDVRANRAGAGLLITRGLGPRTRAVASAHLDSEAARVDDGLTLSRGRSTVAEVAAGGQYEDARLRLDAALGLAVPLGLGAPVRPEGKLVAAYAPVADVAFTATVARKGRLPTLRERYRSDAGTAGLDGEVNDFAEARVAIGGARHRLESAAWARWSDGLIKTDPATRRFTNSGALDLQGVDVSAVIGRDQGVEGGAAYSFIEAGAPGRGEPLDFLARHRAQLHLAARPIEGLWTEVRLRVMGRRLDRQQWLPEYQALDLAGSYEAGPWVISGQLTDLLDRRYLARAGVPSTGRALAVTVTRQW